MKDLYVLEYSVTKQEWMIQKLSITLKINKNHFLKGQQGSFVPLAVSESIDKLEQIKESLAKEKLVSLHTFH